MNCPYVSPSGDPCLKVGGHADLPVSWHCPRGHDDNAPGRAEPYECSRCGMWAQSPTQHLTMRGIKKIEPLEKYAVERVDGMTALPYLYTRSFMDGVLTRGAKPEPKPGDAP